MEHHAALERVVAVGERRLQQRRRRRALVAVQLRVTLVGGDDEVVLLGELERVPQEVERQHRAGGIAGAAEEQDLAALPDLGGHRVEIGLEAIAGGGVEEHGLGAGEQRRAFVDLIERIRHRDHGLRRGAARC